MGAMLLLLTLQAVWVFTFQAALIDKSEEGYIVLLLTFTFVFFLCMYRWQLREQ